MGIAVNTQQCLLCKSDTGLEKYLLPWFDFLDVRSQNPMMMCSRYVALFSLLHEGGSLTLTAGYQITLGVVF